MARPDPWMPCWMPCEAVRVEVADVDPRAGGREGLGDGPLLLGDPGRVVVVDRVPGDLDR